MKRSTRKSGAPNIKPVEKVSISEKHTGLRIAASVVLVLTAVAFITYAVSNMIKKEKGWTAIEAKITAEQNLSQELVFHYEIGLGDKAANVEYKAVSKLYASACGEAYRLFDKNYKSDDVKNLYYINQHPNEEITVDKPLYDAFLFFEEKGSRYIYGAPVYSIYEQLFLSGSDLGSYELDPLVNDNIKNEIAEILDFVNDGESVKLELLGDCRVILKVSESYSDFAEKHYIDSFIDFFWFKNALAVDHIASVFNENGYTRGVINSYDGFTRHLGNVSVPLTYDIVKYNDSNPGLIARMDQSNGMNIVYLRSYMQNSKDILHYYETADGEVRTPYIDLIDGKCKTAVSDFIMYSDKKNCTEIALDAYSVYTADALDTEKIKISAGNNIFSFYSDTEKLYYTEPDMPSDRVYFGDNTSYTKEFVK